MGIRERLEEYPDQLGIALTDCITMDAFLRDFGPEFATRYQGLRHDSTGSPLSLIHIQKKKKKKRERKKKKTALASMQQRSHSKSA